MRTLFALSLFFLSCLSMVSCVVPHDYDPGILTRLKLEAASKRVEWNGVVISDEPELNTEARVVFRNGLFVGADLLGLNDSGTPAEQRTLIAGWEGAGPWETEMEAGLAYVDPHEVGDKLFGFPDYWLLYLIARQVNELAEGRHLFGPLVELGVRRRADGAPAQGESLAIGAWHEWHPEWDCNPNFSVRHELKGVHDTGSLGFESVTLARYDVGLYLPLWNNTAEWKVVGLGLTTPLSSARDGQETEQTVSTALTFSFGRKRSRR